MHEGWRTNDISILHIVEELQVHQILQVVQFVVFWFFWFVFFPDSLQPSSLVFYLGVLAQLLRVRDAERPRSPC